MSLNHLYEDNSMNSLTYIQNEFLLFLNPHDHVHHDPHDHAHRGRHDQINCPKILFLHARAHHGRCEHSRRRLRIRFEKHSVLLKYIQHHLELRKF